MEPPRSEPPGSEPSRSEPSRSEPSRSEPSRSEPRRVVVTGASRGIGEQLALAFAARGDEVLVVARSTDELAAVAERTGGGWLAADLTDERDVDALVDRCVRRLGHVDVWVNNAGMETEDAFVHVDRGELRRLARLNFEATVLLTRDVVPHMLRRGRGHIVQLSSITGTAPFPGLAAYAGTKAGITNFTETLRLELRGRGIGLTVVAPGPVTTGMWDRIEHDGWSAPARRRFDRLFFLPEVDPADLAADVVDAVDRGRPFVRPMRRYAPYHVINNLPRRVVQLVMSGVRMPPLQLDDRSAWEPIWPVDNPPSRVWPLYTRGNVGEVFPEVVLPLTWELFGGSAEQGWRRAFERMGLLRPSDLPAGPGSGADKQIVGVFGGYCYLNASLVRLLGVRAPGGTVEAIDTVFFGESDAPAYEPAPGHKDLAATIALGRTVVRLLRTADVPELAGDLDDVRAYQARYPGDAASDDQLWTHVTGLAELFERLFCRHIEITFSVALVSGALADLCAKAGRPDELVSLLGGIGDVESAGPSSAMWELARSARDIPEVASAFDRGVDGLAQRLQDEPAAAAWISGFDRFLDRFGSRGPNEWDMGADPWAFRPELALAAIDRMRGADPEHAPSAQAVRLAERRTAAVAALRGRLGPADRFQFDRALRATTVFSQARERSKTTIILAVHSARLAQRELARRIAERGGPAERWHSCLLSPDEFRAALDDPAPWNDVVAERLALHRELSSRIPPFVVDGQVPDLSTWERRETSGAAAPSVGEVVRGIAGCPGVARGRARVVLDPGHPGDLGPGDVLVAPITDPSWTPLFLAADAVVVDVGATMSHAVIVSRELGVPCVVSATGATRRIPDGAILEVDGNAGTVTVVELPETRAASGLTESPSSRTES